MKAISVTVRFFAASRERAGRSTDTVALPEPFTVAHLLEVLVATYPALGPVMPHLRVAVAEEFVALDTLLGEHADVALIPPVAGGAPELFAVVSRPLELAEVVDAVGGPDHGGVVTFSGSVRNATRGRAVKKLEYEAYGAMAEKLFRRIGDEARQRWPGVRLAIVHRVGTLEPGALAVVLAASAPHRQDAFAACQFAIERLKQDAPIWKKEFFDDGEVWVGLGP